MYERMSYILSNFVNNNLGKDFTMKNFLDEFQKVMPTSLNNEYKTYQFMDRLKEGFYFLSYKIAAKNKVLRKTGIFYNAQFVNENHSLFYFINLCFTLPK